MPGSLTTPGRSGACDGAEKLFRQPEPPLYCLPRKAPCRHPGYPFAAQWLAYALPCRRFADALAGACARLGADVDRYSFIIVDLHHLLLAGLPAHALPGLTQTSHSHSPLFISR
jgi:hypothetical protein